MAENTRNSRFFKTSVTIYDTSGASSTGGSLVVRGGLSTKDTFVEGHVMVNNVKITPNRNDIVYEQQASLSNDTTEWTNISGFEFDSAVTNGFKAVVNVTVSTGISKYALWEINGVYKPAGWVITSSFTGDITGVQFNIIDDGGIGKLQYKNSNSAGTTTIRFRATTTAPPGTTPLTASSGIIENTSGPYISNTLVYANSPNTLASSDLTYTANVLRIGGTSRIVGENANNFVNFSNGGALTSMGDASVAKRLIVGQRVGISNTAPNFNLDITGDVNFTGNLYKNGSLFSAGGGSSLWETTGNDIYYTSGNIGIGTSAPSVSLDVIGNARFTAFSSGNGNVTALTTGNLRATDSIITNISSGTLNLSTGLTAANINFTGNLYKNGSVYVSSQWNTDPDFNIYYSTGYVGINTSTPTTHLDVKGTARIATSLTTGALVVTGGSLLSDVTSTNITSTNVKITNADVTTLTSGTLVVTNLSAGNVIAKDGLLAGVSQSSYKLDVNGTSLFRNGNGSNTLTNNQFLLGYGGLNEYKHALKTRHQAGADDDNNAIDFFVWQVSDTNSGIGSKHGMSITSVGVGIGTTSPSAKLDVRGGVRISSSLTTGALVVTGGSVFTDVLATNVSAGNAKVTDVVSTNISTASLLASNDITVNGNITIGGNLTVSGTTTTVNTETTILEDNLLVINSGPAGLADGGILVKRYVTGTSGSSNYAGFFYKESTDEFTFALTDSDPGANPVVINDYLPLRAKSLTLETSGSLTASSAQLTNLTTGNLRVNGLNVVSNSFTAANNVTSSTNVTGFLIPSSVNSFESSLTVVTTLSGSTLYENFTLSGIRTSSGWRLFVGQKGDSTGLQFTITSEGQLQYTSTNLSGFVSSTFRWYLFSN